jgi:hypothetical protein
MATNLVVGDVLPSKDLGVSIRDFGMVVKRVHSVRRGACILWKGGRKGLKANFIRPAHSNISFR